MNNTPLSGRLEETPFAGILGELYRGRKTGTLSLSSADKARQVVFFEGDPVAVVSEDARDHLARFLAAKKKITPEQAARLQELPETKESLQSADFLSKDVLAGGLKLRFVNLAYDLFRWTGGEFSFEEGPLPRDIFLMKVPAASLLLKGMRHMPQAALEELVASELQVAAGPLGTEGLGTLGEEEGTFLAACRQGGHVRDLISGASLEPSRARELLYAFRSLGVVSLIPAAAGAAEAEAEEEPLSDGFDLQPIDEPFPKPEPEPAPEPPPEPEPAIDAPVPEETESAFEIERHSYEEQAAQPPPGEPAPLFGEPEEEGGGEVPGLGTPGLEEPAPPGLGEELAPIGFDEETAPPPPGDLEAPPSLEAPAPAVDLPPPPWQGASGEAAEEDAFPPGAPAPEEGGASPFVPPSDENAPARPAERPPRPLKEPGKPSRSPVSPKGLLLGAGVVLLIVVGAGLFFGSKFLRSTLSPLPPIPPAEEKGELEMAEGLPVPAIPKGKKETAQAEDISPEAPSAPAEPAASPKPAPEANTSAAPSSDIERIYARGLTAYRQGDLLGATLIWKEMVGKKEAAYTLHIVAACQPDTVKSSFRQYGERGLFVLPLQLQGRDCFRVLLRVFPDRDSAQKALDNLPSHLKEGVEVRATKGL